MVNLNKVDRRQWVKFFTHLVVISMLFVLPEMMLNYSRPHRGGAMGTMMYVKSAVFVAFFYINYYVIISHTLFGKKHSYLRFIAWNMLLILVYFAIYYYLNQRLWEGHAHSHDMPRSAGLLRAWSFMLRDLAMIVLTVALSAFLRFAEKWGEMEKRHEQMVASQRQEELESLKSQLNPHFLFNTLNTIYSLIEVSPKEAQSAVHQLSKLLRNVLYESPTKHKLAQEIDFERSYIALMEMRLGVGMIKADFSQVANPDIEIAPLLFVTIIENAFKHGITGNHDHKIEITISSDSDGHVMCRTFNHFVAKSTAADKKEGGIGLANLRRRLLLLYGDNAHLNTRVEGDTYTAEIDLMIE